MYIDSEISHVFHLRLYTFLIFLYRYVPILNVDKHNATMNKSNLYNK